MSVIGLEVSHKCEINIHDDHQSNDSLDYLLTNCFPIFKFVGKPVPIRATI